MIYSSTPNTAVSPVEQGPETTAAFDPEATTQIPLPVLPEGFRVRHALGQELSSYFRGDDAPSSLTVYDRTTPIHIQPNGAGWLVTRTDQKRRTSEEIAIKPIGSAEYDVSATDRYDDGSRTYWGSGVADTNYKRARSILHALYRSRSQPYERPGPDAPHRGVVRVAGTAIEAHWAGGYGLQPDFVPRQRPRTLEEYQKLSAIAPIEAATLQTPAQILSSFSTASLFDAIRRQRLQ